MSDLKTLKEVCSLINVSRRVIQGYENKGLIHTDLKDKYGHLLYDSKAVERIICIRFYQKMGFELKEIAEFINYKDSEIEKILNDRLNVLKNEQIKRNNELQLIENIIRNNEENNIDKYLEVIIGRK